MNVTNVFLDDFIKRTPSCKELTLVSFLMFSLIVGYQVYAWDHRIIPDSRDIE